MSQRPENIRVVTVLVIVCPHALGLAVSLAVSLVVGISTTMGVGSGLLVRDRRGLEEARNLDAVIFDKTGTLTAPRCVKRCRLGERPA